MSFARIAYAAQENAAIPASEALPAQAGALNGTAALNATAPLPMPEPIFSWSVYFEALAWLFIGLGILWLVLRYLKKKGGLKLPGASLGLAIEGRLALGPKRWLLVVRFNDRRMLLGVTDHHISFLAHLDDGEDAFEHVDDIVNDRTGSFSDLLKARTDSGKKKEP